MRPFFFISNNDEVALPSHGERKGIIEISERCQPLTGGKALSQNDF